MATRTNAEQAEPDVAADPDDLPPLPRVAFGVRHVVVAVVYLAAVFGLGSAIAWLVSA